MTEQKITYKKAFKRVEEIVAEIQGDNPDVDKLTELVKEGLELLKHCKQHLRNTEEELNSAMEEVD